MRQYGSICHFSNPESWVVLNDFELKIKAKIESIGTPLKNWNISIYRGILTGYNEAFIINSKKRDELISSDPKSAEVLRPILRGRDIKRYGFEYGNLWIINTHNGMKEKGITPIDIDSYPAIKKHLDGYYPELEKRLDKGITPYHLRNCAYVDDFNREKILWAETMRVHKSSQDKFPRFGYDDSGTFLTDKTCFFATGNEIKHILATLNSTMGRYLCSQYVSILDDGGYLMQKLYLERIPIPFFTKETTCLIDKILNGDKDRNELEDNIDALMYELYQLSDEEISFVKSVAYY